MRRLFTYMTLALALLSCTRTLDLPEQSGDRFDLNLFVASSGPGTKGTVVQDPNGSPGEVAYNENLIKTLDIFFYAYGSAETDAALHHIYKGDANTNNRWQLSDNANRDLLRSIFGNDLQNGSLCIVYAVVNYSPASGSSFADNATRSHIRQQIVSSDSFNKVDANRDGIPQEYFVMEGSTEIQASLVGGLYYVSGEVPVYRSAAKMRLEATIPDQIVQNGVEDGNGFNWKPLPDQMQVVLVHGVKNGIVCAMDEQYTYGFTQGADDYFAEATDGSLYSIYGHRMLETGQNAQGKTYEHKAPLYSFPTKDWKNTPANETYLTLILPWHREDMANDVFKNTYYQIPVAVNPNDPEYRLKHNRYYRMEVEVGILGSFELEDKVQLFPSTYIVLDWSIKKDTDDTTAPVSMSQTAYLAVATHRDTLSNINSHSVAYASSHNVTVKVDKIQYLDYLNKKVRVAQITSDQPNRIYYYDTYTVAADGSYTVSGTSTYVASNGIYASYSADATTDPDTGETLVTFTHNIDPNSMYSTVNAYVTVSNGVVEDEHIVFTQHPPIRIEAHQSNGYMFVNGTDNGASHNDVYTGANDWIGSVNERSTAAGLNLTGNNTNPNVYAIYISSFASGSSYIIGDPRVATPDNKLGHTDASWSGATQYNYSTTDNGGTYGTYYFNYSEYSSNTSWINREYTTGNFNNVTNNWGSYNSENNAYGPDANHYYYWRTGNMLNRTYHRTRYSFTGYRITSFDGLSNYYPTQTTGTEDMIAPAFLIASSYGKTAYNNDGTTRDMTWERAQMRCALYQEDGYPAGRWRLPTYSEVKFIMELSNAGKIPTLFQMDSGGDSVGYWCANGRIYTNRDDSVALAAATATPTAPRCVYDLWYWGEENTTYATTWHLGDND